MIDYYSTKRGPLLRTRVTRHIFTAYFSLKSQSLSPLQLCSNNSDLLRLGSLGGIACKTADGWRTTTL